MGQASPTIKCRKCGATFEPDMKSKEKWSCPSCQTKNPNLKRHYRSVADLCILGLVLGLIIVAVRIKDAGLNVPVLLFFADSALLLLTIVAVYRSRAPWADSRVKLLIWITFGVALLGNVVVPLILSGRLNLIAVILYTVIFAYLLWLNAQAAKCTPSADPPVVTK